MTYSLVRCLLSGDVIFETIIYKTNRNFDKTLHFFRLQLLTLLQLVQFQLWMDKGKNRFNRRAQPLLTKKDPDFEVSFVETLIRNPFSWKFVEPGLFT